MTIEATTKQGVMRISYVSPYMRTYSWDGNIKTFRHQPRRSRWYGSLGMYRPTGDGTLHAVLEEGQQHFASEREAYEWLGEKKKFGNYVWDRDGLVVGWKQQRRPEDGFVALHVDVWQLYVNGKRADTSKGASPSRIKVTNTPAR